MLIEHHIEDRAHARLCDGRDVVAVLTQEARRLAKGVNELRDATGGRTANIYQFACGSVAYFAPEAPDFQEAGDLDKALRVLDESGTSCLEGTAISRGFPAFAVEQAAQQHRRWTQRTDCLWRNGSIRNAI